MGPPSTNRFYFDNEWLAEEFIDDINKHLPKVYVSYAPIPDQFSNRYYVISSIKEDELAYLKLILE